MWSGSQKRRDTRKKRDGLKISKFNENYKPQIQEAQRIPITRNKENYSHTIIIKLLKSGSKESILKVSREKIDIV